MKDIYHIAPLLTARTAHGGLSLASFGGLFLTLFGGLFTLSLLWF